MQLLFFWKAEQRLQEGSKENFKLQTNECKNEYPLTLCSWIPTHFSLSVVNSSPNSSSPGAFRMGKQMENVNINDSLFVEKSIIGFFIQPIWPPSLTPHFPEICFHFLSLKFSPFTLFRTDFRLSEMFHGAPALHIADYLLCCLPANHGSSDYI